MIRPGTAARHRRTASAHTRHRSDADAPASNWALLQAAIAPLAILIIGAAADLTASTIFGRVLGPENYGDYAVAVSGAMICASLAKLGADETLPRFLPPYLHRRRFRLAAGVLRGHFAANMAVAVLIAAGFFIFYIRFKNIAFDHPLALIWLVVPLITLDDYLFEVLVTMRAQVIAMALEAIVFPAVLIVAIYVFDTLRGGMTDNASVVAFGTAVLALAPVYYASARWRLPARLRHAAPAYDASRWARFGLAVALSGFAYVAYTQLSLQIVELLDEDESNVGRFAAASKIADLVLLADYAIHITILPRLALLLDGGSRAAIQRFVGRVTAAVLAGGAALAALVIVFETPLTRLFGEGFEGAIGPLIILGLGNFMLAPLSFAWTYLSLSGHEREPVIPIIAGFFALAILSYLTIPHWHIVAAALCKVAVGLGVYGWMAFRVWRLLGVRLWRLG